MKQYLDDIINNHIYMLDEMMDWVRIVDKSGDVLYANKKMCSDFNRDLRGEKCYNLLDRKAKCGECISNYTIRTGEANEKEIKLSDKTYNVTSSPFTGDNGEVLAAVEVFRDITYAKRLTEELNYKNKVMTNDINFAKNMQKRMLPPKEIYNGLKIDHLYEPSDMLSGDMFDAFKINDEKTGLYICDVVGHGVSASLLTMFVRQSVRTLIRNQHDIVKMMKELHKMFLSLNLDSDKYFSIFFGIYDKNKREFSYINAGHNTKPILYSNRGITFLESKGYPICNLFEDVEYDVSTIKLQINDKLLFYTDGIIEAKNNNSEEFGEDRIIDIIKDSKNILIDIYYSVKKFSVGSLKDDCALMIVEVVD
ncbi:SpoIIE family protein phosphatase [Sedimentibacter sp. zth1]|uniref:SpoIIE family protein phosphatase n=1 Tax=Sedimentibacter sp. zth1 TaxID=2816908 RepID=UPI001A92CA99|nr:SpoIIE family protein phosphatase [Sedimentibacter sp. zth1]QSX05317.1 SpoIIE family protein phosphatase [Sedimentibacter sp. zth1]